jgi:hypothetical protein
VPANPGSILNGVIAALINLNHPGKYVHWGFIQISVANLVVIALMLVIFVLAIVLPFPHSKAKR